MPHTNQLCQMYAEAEHEKVVLWSDPASSYRGIIAIHSTALGPAVGSTRIWNYASDEAATFDALKLSRAMSYKNALADLPFGGGQAVIMAHDDNIDREGLLRVHGRFVQSLGGRFIIAEDARAMTGYGVFRALQAAANHRWGSRKLNKRRVAIQGCGKTGYALASLLHESGAKLFVADIDAAKVKRVVNDFGAVAVAPEDIVGVDADVLAPCARGEIINDETIRRLKVGIVVGSANNQLLEDRHGDALHELGILYVPDYVANAGGIIHGCRDLLGWSEKQTKERVHRIYDTVLGILETAGCGSPPFRVANQLAARKLMPQRSTKSTNEFC